MKSSTSSSRAKRALNTPGQVYNGIISDSGTVNSPQIKQAGQSGVYGLPDPKAQGLRNQNSASLSTAKPLNGSVGGTHYSQPTGSQRVRDKLLINSGGLALGQNPQTQHGPASAAHRTLPPTNGTNSAQKSPQIGSRFQQANPPLMMQGGASGTTNGLQQVSDDKQLKQLMQNINGSGQHMTQHIGLQGKIGNPGQSSTAVDGSSLSNQGGIQGGGTTGQAVSTPIPQKNNKLVSNSNTTPTGSMTSHVSGPAKARLITANSQAKHSNSQVRSNTYGHHHNQPPNHGGSQRNNSVPFNMQNSRGQGGAQANTRRFNNATPALPKRRIENLPRTGIEYPIMKLQTQFICQHKEHEPLTEKACPQEKIDEYIANDAERANQPIPSSTVVYDSVEPSPNYDNTPNDLYIDERDLIELPAPHQQDQGQINEPYQKRYYFNPMNLPYNLEQSSAYSARVPPPGEKSSGKSSENRGPRLNRYYETLKPYYKLKEPVAEDKTLVFESRFESANLRKAVKINDYEYDLYLKNDYGTNGFTQWYYFRVQNTRKDTPYRFNIVNLMKPDSNYNQGMKPLIYSVKEAEQSRIGWQRDGFNIAYYQGQRKKRAYNQQQSGGALGSMQAASTGSSIPGGPSQTSGYGPVYYALTFEIIFKHDNDTVFFAHCYPFTYSDQCNFISKVCTFSNKDKIRKTVLCKSLAGNDVDMLIVTNFLSDPVDIAVRKSIILSSRVHPGESNSSFVMNGVIDFLVSDDEHAEFLRNTFVFKIVPMLNPDGVIVGNYRCSLMGQDLNRQWIGSSSKFYPINYHTKLMMKRTLESRDIFFFCDFHGHSTGRNVFMFGNNQTKPQERNKEKIFPMLFSENIDMFGFEDCSFAVQKSRESTARIVMWKEFQLVNSFTLEASFLGPNKGVNAGLHFNPTHLQIMGRVFCKTLVDYVDNQERVNRVFTELKNRFPQGGGCVRQSSQYNNKTDEEKDF